MPDQWRRCPQALLRPGYGREEPISPGRPRGLRQAPAPRPEWPSRNMPGRDPETSALLNEPATPHRSRRPTTRKRNGSSELPFGRNGESAKAAKARRCSTAPRPKGTRNGSVVLLRRQRDSPRLERPRTSSGHKAHLRRFRSQCPPNGLWERAECSGQ
jgi:hypothetical protein